MASTSSAAAPPLEQDSTQSHDVPQISPAPIRKPHPADGPQITAAAPVAAAATADPAVESGVPPQSYHHKLNAGDQHWIWKIALRAILIVVGIIGIGCAASVVARDSGSLFGDYFFYGFGDEWTIPWTLITFAVSVIWCAVCILVFLLRRPAAPVHPGAQVGIDLVVWLGFCVTAAIAVVGVVQIMSWGQDGVLTNYSGYGDFQYVQSNNSWVYQNVSTDGSNSYYGINSYCGTYLSNDDGEATCADVANALTIMWRRKNGRVNLDLTVTVCQFISLVLHFALFVWACVDTHRRNSSKNKRKAEALANEMVKNMIATGVMIPNSEYRANGGVNAQPMTQATYQGKGKAAAPRYT